MMVFKIFSKFFLINLLFLSVFAAKNALSETNNGNPYIIKNVFSSAQKDNSSASRLEAKIQANRIAFFILLDNLNVDKLSYEEIDDEEISQLVYSKRIKEEKIAGKYYSAKFTILFDKGAVGNLLDKESIKPYVLKNGGDKFLIFPIQMSSGKPVLWENSNIWKKEIQEAINIRNIRHIIVPNGDDGDMLDIELNNVKQEDISDFGNILSKYDANKVLIAYYEFDAIENKSNIILKTIKFPQIDRVRLSFVNSQNLDKYDLISESANRTLNHILEKSRNEEKKITYKPDEKINLSVEIADLEEWIAIKNRIRNMHFVKDLKLRSISRDVAKITLTSNGDYKDIKKLFTQYNFILRTHDSGEYFISLMKDN